MVLADVTLDPSVRSEVNLTWSHPAEYINNQSIPDGNILRTAIQRSSDGFNYSPIGEVPYPVTVYQDLTEPLGEGVYSYRVFSIVAGNIISSPSNVQVVTLFIPKPSMPPILMVE